MQDLIPESVYRSLVEAGEEFYDKQAAAEVLEHTQKSVLAQLTMACKRSEKTSMAEATTMAQACAEYRDTWESAIEARKEAGKARVRYEATKALFEARRTAEATQRAVLRAAP